MRGLLSKSTNPAFNLAAEEYLLKSVREDIFFLYINKPCIVVGKHQNTLAEIDYNFTTRNSIPAFRRLSGGGTVYHDLGNLNFCFITNEEKGNLVNFDKHSLPIVKALKNLGLSVSIGKRHDLSVNGKKITGTASHVFKNRAMHHGTLLFNTDLTVLNRCFSSDTQKFEGKAVKSIRSTVTNISEHLTQQLTTEEFTSHIFNFLLAFFPDAQTFRFSNIENEIITNLVKEKYSIWKWNYGYSPVYELSENIEVENIQFSSKLKVEKGLIKSVSLSCSDSKYQKSLDLLSHNLVGVKHEKKLILSHLETTGIKILSKQLIYLFFS